LYTYNTHIHVYNTHTQTHTHNTYKHIEILQVWILIELSEYVHYNAHYTIFVPSGTLTLIPSNLKRNFEVPSSVQFTYLQGAENTPGDGQNRHVTSSRDSDRGYAHIQHTRAPPCTVTALTVVASRTDTLT
jgi:hypothetical protein